MVEDYVIDKKHPFFDSDTGYEISDFYKIYQGERFVGVINDFSKIFYRVENETITLPNFETWDLSKLYWLCGTSCFSSEDKLEFHMKEAIKYHFDRVKLERNQGYDYKDYYIHYMSNWYLSVKEGQCVYSSLVLWKHGTLEIVKCGIDVVFKQICFVLKAIPIILLRLYLLEFKKIFDFSSDSTYIAFRKSVDTIKYAICFSCWTYFETEIISDRKLSKRQLRYQYKKQNGLLFLQELRELLWQKN